MNQFLRGGVVIVQLALVAYSVGTLLLQKGGRATRAIVAWLAVGVCFDVVATACMIVGSARGLFTLHGLLGYSALAVMLVDVVRVVRHRRAAGDAPIPRALHLYSRYAYLWWVIAYVTGAALVVLERRAG